VPRLALRFHKPLPIMSRSVGLSRVTTDGKQFVSNMGPASLRPNAKSYSATARAPHTAGPIHSGKKVNLAAGD
jgi:hypothetical protein